MAEAFVSLLHDLSAAAAASDTSPEQPLRSPVSILRDEQRDEASSPREEAGGYGDDWLANQIALTQAMNAMYSTSGDADDSAEPATLEVAHLDEVTPRLGRGNGSSSDASAAAPSTTGAPLIEIGTSAHISDDFCRQVYSMINASYGHQRVTIAEVRRRLAMGDGVGDGTANRVLHLAWRGGRLVGCCSSTRRVPWCDDECGHWGLLTVTPADRDSGVGHALVAAAEERLRAAKLRSVQIEYEYQVGDAASERLRGWYEGSCGFSCDAGPPSGEVGDRMFRRCRKALVEAAAEDEAAEEAEEALAMVPAITPVIPARLVMARETSAAPAALPAAAPVRDSLEEEAGGAEAVEAADSGVCCRFCLSEDERRSLLCYPCLCTAPVHRQCLVRWQRQQATAERTRCEVCRADWTMPLRPFEGECWLRRAAQEPNAAATGVLESVLQSVLGGNTDGALDEATVCAMRSAVSAGAIIVQSPYRAAVTGRQVNACARALHGDTRALTLFEPTRADVVRGDAAAAAAGGGGAHHARHGREQWHMACCLVLHVDTPHGATDADTSGGGIVIAANLTRPPLEPPPPVPGDASGDGAHTPRRAELGLDAALCAEAEVRTALALSSPQGVWASGRRLPILDGGPCFRDAPLCLLQLRPGWRGAFPLDEELDALPIHLDPIGGDSDSDSDGSGDDDAAAASVLYVAEPAVAVRLAQLGRLQSAAIVLGVSVWSTDQLLGEIVRGGWGVCRGRVGDAPLPIVGEGSPADGAAATPPSNHDEQAWQPFLPELGVLPSAAQNVERRQRAVFELWSSCWRLRSPMCVEAQVNPMMTMLR